MVALLVAASGLTRSDTCLQASPVTRTLTFVCDSLVNYRHSFSERNFMWDQFDDTAARSLLGGDGVLSDSTDNEERVDNFLSSGSDDESRLRFPCNAKTVLHAWGVSESVADLPMLIVPSPIAYLMLNGKWEHVLLRADWHTRLINREGKKFNGEAIFNGTIV